MVTAPGIEGGKDGLKCPTSKTGQKKKKKKKRKSLEKGLLPAPKTGQTGTPGRVKAPEEREYLILDLLGLLEFEFVTFWVDYDRTVVLGG